MDLNLTERVSKQRSFSFPLRGWSLLNVVLLVYFYYSCSCLNYPNSLVRHLALGWEHLASLWTYGNLRIVYDSNHLGIRGLGLNSKSWFLTDTDTLELYEPMDPRTPDKLSGKPHWKSGVRNDIPIWNNENTSRLSTHESPRTSCYESKCYMFSKFATSSTCLFRTTQNLSKGSILSFEMSLLLLWFPFYFGFLLHSEGNNQQKSKTWRPPPLVVVLGETKIAMLNAAISVHRRLLCILAFHFYLI